MKCNGIARHENVLAKYCEMENAKSPILVYIGNIQYGRTNTQNIIF